MKQDAKNGNISAARELKVKTALKEIVKVQKPKNIIEHLNIVKHDINKLFSKADIQTKDNKNNIPTSFALYQNYPNPFNPGTKIMYDIPASPVPSKGGVLVKLIVYDILGREVARLINNELKQPGRYSIDWNGNNFASGVYFYKIEAGNFVQAKKMVLIK